MEKEYENEISTTKKSLSPIFGDGYNKRIRLEMSYFRYRINQWRSFGEVYTLVYDPKRININYIKAHLTEDELEWIIFQLLEQELMK